MSHSFKNNIPGTCWIKTPVCVVHHCALSIWKKDNQRWKRRFNRKLIHLFLTTKDEKYLNKLINKLNKSTRSDVWNGPHDGYWDNEFVDYQGYMK
jgi:hypothetical protein